MENSDDPPRKGTTNYTKNDLKAAFGQGDINCNYWMCSQCTYLNDGSDKICYLCSHAQQPKQLSGDATGSASDDGVHFLSSSSARSSTPAAKNCPIVGVQTNKRKQVDSGQDGAHDSPALKQRILKDHTIQFFSDESEQLTTISSSAGSNASLSESKQFSCGTESSASSVMNTDHKNWSDTTPDMWSCPRCTYLNLAQLNCCDCCDYVPLASVDKAGSTAVRSVSDDVSTGNYRSAPLHPVGGESSDIDGNWDCPRCTFINHLALECCEVCAYRRRPVIDDLPTINSLISKQYASLVTPAAPAASSSLAEFTSTSVAATSSKSEVTVASSPQISVGVTKPASVAATSSKPEVTVASSPQISVGVTKPASVAATSSKWTVSVASSPQISVGVTKPASVAATSSKWTVSVASSPQISVDMTKPASVTTARKVSNIPLPSLNLSRASTSTTSASPAYTVTVKGKSASISIARASETGLASTMPSMVHPASAPSSLGSPSFNKPVTSSPCQLTTADNQPLKESRIRVKFNLMTGLTAVISPVSQPVIKFSETSSNKPAIGSIGYRLRDGAKIPMNSTNSPIVNAKSVCSSPAACAVTAATTTSTETSTRQVGPSVATPGVFSAAIPHHDTRNSSGNSKAGYIKHSVSAAALLLYGLNGKAPPPAVSQPSPSTGSASVQIVPSGNRPTCVATSTTSASGSLTSSSSSSAAVVASASQRNQQQQQLPPVSHQWNRTMQVTQPQSAPPRQTTPTKQMTSVTRPSQPTATIQRHEIMQVTQPQSAPPRQTTPTKQMTSVTRPSQPTATIQRHEIMQVTPPQSASPRQTKSTQPTPRMTAATQPPQQTTSMQLRHQTTSAPPPQQTTTISQPSRQTRSMQPPQQPSVSAAAVSSVVRVGAVKSQTPAESTPASNTLHNGPAWHCSRCTFINVASALECECCLHGRENDLTMTIDPARKRLPVTWTSPVPGQPCKKVLLAANDPEYIEVEQNALRTSRNFIKTIVEIQRIENPTLYELFSVRRTQIVGSNSSPDMERLLWHGTASETVDKICYRGFNRSYCGKNATAFGKGVYFAREFWYSAQNLYSPPNRKKVKSVFQCRVLTGKFTLGNPNFVEPPSLNNNSPELYDSVVDNVANPGIFVIFHDAMVYPEFLITFKS